MAIRTASIQTDAWQFVESELPLCEESEDAHLTPLVVTAYKDLNDPEREELSESHIQAQILLTETTLSLRRSR